MSTLSTLVIQSHTDPLPYSWLSPCIDSVRRWADRHGFDYQWLGDELFDDLDSEVIKNTAHQKVVAADLARLQVVEKCLAQYERVIWCDADVLIFGEGDSLLVEGNEAFGRELWVQEASVTGKSKDRLQPVCHKKIHNAFMLFQRGSTFLPFYRDSANNLLHRHSGPYVSQFIGPKLLAAWHNILPFTVIESAGMLSPLLAKDLLAGGGPFLECYRSKQLAAPEALNLCASSVENGELDNDQMSLLVEILVREGKRLFAIR